MARLIPRIDPDQIDNRGERYVAKELLNQLPKAVDIYHSIDWLGRTKHRYFVQGECDFTIVDPKRGILFLEVKGGSIHYDNASGVWRRVIVRGQKFQNIKDPFAQAKNSMHQLADVIKNNLGLRSLPFTYSCAVAFPDFVFAGQPPPGMDKNQIWDHESFRDLNKSVSKVFNIYWQGTNQAFKGISPGMMSSINAALKGKFSIFPVLCREIERQEEQLYRCTEDQKKVFLSLQKWNKFAVEGGAGTGKTLLAVWKAQQLALSGSKTLLLCYNKALADWLQKFSSENLTICNYHSLAHRFCDMAGEEFNPKTYGRKGEFWNSIAPEKLIDAAEHISEDQKFDAVVVDEGQDFRELWWMSLECVYRCPPDDRCFYVFFDPNQNLYVRNNWNLPDELKGKEITLRENCRNSAQIAEHCASLVGISFESSIRPMKSLAELKIYQEKNVRQAFSRAGNIVRKLCVSTAGPLSYSQVVVLAPKYSTIAGDIYQQWPNGFKSVPVTQDPEQWQKNQGVLIITAHSFKGLEAEAVIMIAKSLPRKRSNDHVVNYVGRSRAKHILRVIEVEEI